MPALPCPEIAEFVRTSIRLAALSLAAALFACLSGTAVAALVIAAGSYL